MQIQNVNILSNGCILIIHKLIVINVPGYGILPYETNSVNKIPKLQTSDLMENLEKLAASGAVHLIGNLAPALASYSSSFSNLAKPKSAIFTMLFSLQRTFENLWK